MADRRSQKMQCPICGKEYAMSAINLHVDRCLEKSQSDQQEKQLLTNNDDSYCDEPPARKRLKVGSSSEPSRPSISQTASKTVSKATTSPADKKPSAWGSLGSPSFKNAPGKDRNSAGQANQHRSVQRTHPFFGGRSDRGNDDAVSSAANRTGRQTKANFAPLAEQMRPSSLGEFIGQEKAVGRNTLLRSLLLANEIPSMILWGPPGCGKTTLARIIANSIKERSNNKMRFVQLSATTSNVAEVKEVVKVAKNEQTMFKKKTVLFIDEIHRFNKLQQDTFLPHVESGTVTLIGATTENPSFQVNTALLSRCRVVVLEKLSVESVESILERAVTSLHGKILEKGEEPGSDSEISDDEEGNRIDFYIEKYALTTLAHLCDGDARAALNSLQIAVQSQKASHQISHGSSHATLNSCPDLGDGERDSTDGGGGEVVVIGLDHIKDGLQRSHILYDRAGEEHYNCISAMQKSIRGSDANAALYWVTRMLRGGEDPLYIARRLVRTASEDIGLGDPQALGMAVSTFQACQFVGMPECDVFLAQCAVYLARAPKSHEVYVALEKAKASIENHEGPLPGVPLHLRNAPTGMMKRLGYGKGYDPRKPLVYMPEGMEDVDFFS
ncbi:ATPase WRNIP1-like [Ptychodera flava]|uniref:ATPase WRNIP1-like n=1 Tax=Ptychodera flava TaxID=63121 RepID=UPI00396A7577